MKKILITGGSGFIGSNLAAYLNRDSEVLILGRNIAIGRHISERLGIEFRSVDVSNYEALRRVVSWFKPDQLIHAAASKYVDYAEGDPCECFETNVRGSVVVAQVAAESNVESVIGISTDKAATAQWTAYGSSKLSMELLFERMNDSSRTRFTSIRFGNVAWSTGSVLPLWTKMRENSGVVRTTGYDMTRFMCSVDSVSLYVQYCLENIDKVDGRTIVPIFKWLYIKDLLASFLADNPCSFECVNPRPGEKRAEVLLSGLERMFSEVDQINDAPVFKIRHGEQRIHSDTELRDFDTSEAEQHDTSSMEKLIQSKAFVIDGVA